MSPKIGVPFIVILLLFSSWAFTNNQTIEQWISENSITVQNDEVELLSLQEQEHWLVLITDFESQPVADAWGPSKAQTLLDDIGHDYIHQLSGGATDIEIVVSSRITRAQHNIEVYGEDSNGNRDMNQKGEFLPMTLAEEVVNDHIEFADWEKYDLDKDGSVDRLLILHTSKGQEENPGQTNNIWSHFTTFDTPIEVAENTKVEHYTMASIRTGSSGIGTILHEMLHQMGALDLYPVHDSGNQNDWQGIGDWDIMASGNWNGGGVWPALPTAATLDMLQANRTQTMDLSWPVNAQEPCVGPTVQLRGMSENGTSLRIPIGESENIWIEYRSPSGFDKHLPGNGILVTYQDRSVGDEEQNELNRDQDQPWLSVIEADGRKDILYGANSGEESDVFQNGSTFGAEGVQIFTHDGLLVPWIATVNINVTVEISFSAPKCTSQFMVDAPDFGGVYIPGDSFPIRVTSNQTCQFSHNLTVSDGRTFIPTANISVGVPEQFIELEFSSASSSNSEAIVEGFFSCGNDSLFIKTKILTIGRIPTETTVRGTLDAYDRSVINIDIESIGLNSQSFSVDLDGPFSRIGSPPSQVNLVGNDSIEIEITPNGLLQDRMSVDGELVLISQSGHRWVIHLEYTAVDKDTSAFSQWQKPGILLGSAGIIAAFWVLLGTLEKTKKADKSTVIHSQVLESPKIEHKDPWGRTLDDELDTPRQPPLDL